MPVLVIARVTLAEAVRRRLFLALLLLTLGSIVLSWWGFSQVATFQPRGEPLEPAARTLLESQLLILVTFMFSFVLGISAAFIAAPMMAADLESGVVLAILARPVRRAELVLGKWIGVFLLVGGYTVAAALAELIVVDLTTGYSPPHPAEAIVFLVAEATILLTLAMALATRLSAITTGVLVVGAFGVAWVLGIIGGIGVAFDNPTVTAIGDASRVLLPTDGLWRGALYQLEPAAVLLAYAQAPRAAAAFPFYVSAPASLAYVLSCGTWIVLVLLAGIWSFRRREL
jgi:ABC-2 type transport system permease protein